MDAFLRALLNLTFDKLKNGLPSCDEIDPQEYLNLIHQLSNRYENHVVIEKLSRSPLEFKLDHVLTEMGPCSTFNSRALNALSWSYLLNSTVQKDKPVLKTYYAEGEVAASILDINGTSSQDVFYHSPLGYPTVKHRIRMPNDSVVYANFHFSTTDIVTHVKVKKLYPDQRKCLFYYEGQLKHSPHVYSQELCLRECRINQMKRFCGCLLPFYRLEAPDERYCNPTDISSCIGPFFG